MLVALYWATALVLQAPATAPRTDPVDAVVKREMERQHIPGVAIAVVRDGRVIKTKGYGWANLELKVPVTTATVFKIGSVSKQFLASGIMLLAQDGKLQTSDPVSKYYADTPASWAPITLRHFLTHTSGVVREGAFDPYKTKPDSEVVRGAFTSDLLFPVGSKWSYCNTCYFALADIIAKVSGESWPEFMQHRIFGPVGMTATRVTTITDLVPNRADGYTWKDGVWHVAEPILTIRPSGAFLSTVLDLAKWENALLGDKILSADSKKEMWTPVTLTDGSSSFKFGNSSIGYGYGWMLDSLDGHRRIQHGGSLAGFRSSFMRYPDDHITVLVLTNLANANPDKIAEGVAATYFRH
jgi:CubicO group peptidase (beta-lactamase class C family)